MKLAAGIAILVMLAGTALAETKADRLFAKGKQQLADKKYAEACATFEEVDRLDPGIGAKMNIAKCYEEWGKLAKAFEWYRNAEKMARDTKDKRADKIKEVSDALDADVPRLTIKLPAGVDPAYAAVRLDGATFPPAELGKEQRVDPGQHAIGYLDGGKPKTKTVTLERGGSTETELVFEAPKKLTDKPPGGTRPSTRNNRKLLGLGIGGAGVLGLGIAGIVTLRAKSSYQDALDDSCRGEPDMCDARGLKLTGNARSRANVATVVSAISLAAVAGGVVLYLTAPKQRPEHALRITPAVGDRSAAVFVDGRF
jgi:tetratricopeptide (TPR) repeat protein